MVKFLKFLAIAIIVSANITMIEAWYRIFLMGGYFNNASFLASAMVGLIAPIAVIYFSVLGIREIIKYK